MITPKIYNENLKKGIVTDDMLGVAIFSVNKRDCHYREGVCRSQIRGEDKSS